MNEPDKHLMEILGKIAAGEGSYVIGYCDHSGEDGDWLKYGGALSARIGLAAMLQAEMEMELEQSYDNPEKDED